MLRLVLVLVFGLATPGAFGHPTNPLQPLDTSDPRATLRAFWQEARALERAYIAYRRDETYAGMAEIAEPLRRMRHLFDLADVPAATRAEVGDATALYLFDVLVRLPPVDMDEVPGGPAFDPESAPRRWSLPDTEIDIVRIEQGPRAGDHLFSSDVVENAPTWHARIIDQTPVQPTAYENWRLQQIRFTGPWFDYDLVQAIPPPLRVVWLGTPLWKAVLVTALAFAALAITWVWGRTVHRLARDGTAVSRLALQLTVPGLLALLAWQLDRFQTWQLNLTGPFGEGQAVAVTAAIIVAAAWAAWIAAYLVVEFVISSPAIPDQSYDAHLLRLLARVAAVAGATAVLVYGANAIGVPALGLLAGVGVGGFALALAAQSTAENLLGGVNLFADRPFRVGDFIRYGADLGTVERIGPRSSRIRGLDNTLTTVPNSDLARMHVTNYSFRQKILFRHVIGLRYETSPEQLVWLGEAVRNELGASPMVESTADHPRVRVLGFGASSIDVEVRANVLTTDYSEFLEVQEALVLAIMRLVAEAGTGFAFPSQTAYLTRDPGLDDEARDRIEQRVRAGNKMGAGKP